MIETVKDFYKQIEKMTEQSYKAFVIALIVYEKEVSYDEALTLFNDFMDDDSKTGLLNIEE